MPLLIVIAIVATSVCVAQVLSGGSMMSGSSTSSGSSMSSGGPMMQGSPMMSGTPAAGGANAATSAAQYTPWQQGVLQGIGIGFVMGRMATMASQGYNVTGFNSEVDRFNSWIKQNIGNDPKLLMPKMPLSGGSAGIEAVSPPGGSAGFGAVSPTGGSASIETISPPE